MSGFQKVAVESDLVAVLNQRAKPAATKQPAKQAQAMVCTTKQTTTKVGLFRKRTKSTTVCTPVKSVPSNVPANGQSPTVGGSVSTESSVADAVPVSSSTPDASNSSSAASTSNSRPRPASTTPVPHGNAGGNSTNVGSSSYVSPVISTPSLLLSVTSDSEPEELALLISPVAEVPEPTTLALLSLGLAGLGLARRHSKK